MSTHKHFDLVCVVVVVCALLITMLFLNGESLGIQKIVDEDAENYTGSLYFTANDLNGDWDSQDATQIILAGDSIKISGQGAYVYDGDVYISGGGYYAVSGTLENGSIVVDAYSSSKVWILLDGVDISCSEDACIKVLQADKVFLTLAAGSENVLSSGAVYSDAALAEGTDGAVFAKDDLTINGSGSLTVQAQYAHGIAANDDLVITGGTITVAAVKDGINANDSIRVRNADIAVTAEDDGIVVSREEGYLYVESGSIHVTAADDGIHTSGDVTVAGGELSIAAGDDGIHSDTRISVMDGTVLVSECYEGLEAVAIEVLGGNITLYPTDDGFNANGGNGDMFGMGGPGMGGGSDGSGMGGGPSGRGGFGRDSDTDTSETSSIDAGSTDMGGTPPKMPERPDAAGMDQADSVDGDEETETYIRISGGTITIINETARDADGLDSNGDIYISGGTIRISLVNNGSNSALDYGSENGGVCEISGGNIIACGSSAMAESFDSTSTQCAILYNISQGAAAGTKLALEDAEGTVFLEYEVPCSFSSAVISCPEMVLGESYLVVIGDDVEEVTLDEVSASFGDAQSSMFGGMNGGGMNGGGMNGGSMQDRGDIGGMQHGHGGRQSENADGEGSGGFRGNVSGNMPGMSDMQPPDGTFSEGDFLSGGPMEQNSVEGNSMEGNPMEGNSMDSGTMHQEPGETSTEDDAETEDWNGTALTEYGSDTWTLVAMSVIVLAAGTVVAQSYRRR